LEGFRACAGLHEHDRELRADGLFTGQFPQPGHLGLQLTGFLLQSQDPADAGQVQAVGGQRAGLRQPVDVPAGVAAGAARAARRVQQPLPLVDPERLRVQPGQFRGAQRCRACRVPGKPATSRRAAGSGLGPIGQFSARIARYLGVERVMGLDPVPERRAAAARFGVETLDPDQAANIATMLIEMTVGRGPDSVIDAVGMEAHGHQEAVGTKLAEVAQQATGLLPDSLARKVTDVAAVDRLDALHVAVKAVRRGGTVSVSGVYGGEVDPMPMMEMFDRGVQLRMGQAHVKRWIDDLMPMVADGSDPLGVTSFATHHLPLEQAPQGYEIFRNKDEGCIKVVLQP
jgi:threonine dehydrogenase-like Zn-dependent dehydrogenase